MMADCEHDWLGVFREEGEQGRYKVVEVCAKCGTFHVDIVGDIQFFDFEFRLTTPWQIKAASKALTDMDAISEYLVSQGWRPTSKGWVLGNE